MDVTVALESQTYFTKMYRKWESRWERFGVRPSLAGLRLLDFGCGFGAFSIRAAEEGAQVVGLDPSPGAIQIAKAIAGERFPTCDVEYVCTDISSLDQSFDLIFTHEVFEHILDLPKSLQMLYDHLVPGGRLYAAWGPLWYSPTGGHQMTVDIRGLPIPWTHLIKPIGRAQFRRATGHSFDSYNEYANFNYLRPRDYRLMAESSPFSILSWRVNPGDHPAHRLIRAAARVAPTPFTSSIYAVLAKSASAGL